MPTRYRKVIPLGLNNHLIGLVFPVLFDISATESLNVDILIKGFL